MPRHGAKHRKRKRGGRRPVGLAAVNKRHMVMRPRKRHVLLPGPRRLGQRRRGKGILGSILKTGIKILLGAI